MGKLRLNSIEDDKPVMLTIELPASVHRDLVAYAEVLGRDDGAPVEPARLITPMLRRFMATDREFAKRRVRRRLAAERPPPPERESAGGPAAGSESA